MQEHEVYAAIGEDGFTRLIAAFYRQVPDDEILGPMYRSGGDLPGAEERLRDFVIFRFGGSQRYIERRGHPRLRMRHAPFAVTLEARDRWLMLMDNALAGTDLPPEAKRVLRSFFEGAAAAMINSD